MNTDSSLLGFATGLIRRRWLLLVTPLVVAGAAVTYGMLTREYVAESRFLPRRANVDASRLTGLAAQFGFNMGNIDAGESIEFYANLLKSREVLLAVAQTEYRFLPAGRSDTVVGTLVDLLDIGGRTPEAVRRAAVRALRTRVVAGTDLQGGMVTLKVVAPYSELAELVNRRLLDLVNDFNLSKRQSQAASERRFTEQRMREAQQELEQAEADLRRFTERNRIVENDPALRLESRRLERRVDLRQQVYVTLAQAFEQARLSEVRDTPLITIVDAPERSGESSVRLAFSAVLGLVLGFFLAVVVILLEQFVARHREEHPSEFASVRTLLGTTLTARMLARVFRRSG